MNESKQRIDELKAGVERGRVQRALPRLGVMPLHGDFAVAEPDAQEVTARQQIDQVGACMVQSQLHASDSALLSHMRGIGMIACSSTAYVVLQLWGALPAAKRPAVALQEKSRYRATFAVLAKKKAEIEQLHAAVKAARAQVQDAFQQWLLRGGARASDQ